MLREDNAKVGPALTSFSSGETLPPMMDITLRGAAMNVRLVSVIASLGTFGLVTLSTYTVLAANALEPQSDDSAVLQLSERNATSIDTSNFEIRSDPALNAMQISNDPGPSKVRYDEIWPSRDMANGRAAGRLSWSHARRSCVVSARTSGDKGRPHLATRHIGERGPARMALVLGVGF